MDPIQKFLNCSGENVPLSCTVNNDYNINFTNVNISGKSETKNQQNANQLLGNKFSAHLAILTLFTNMRQNFLKTSLINITSDLNV